MDAILTRMTADRTALCREITENVERKVGESLDEIITRMTADRDAVQEHDPSKL